MPVLQGVAPAQQACPSAPQAAQVPGVPWATARPVHAKPVLQVPAVPVPQQGCPEPPHAEDEEQTLPLDETVHESPVSQVAAPKPPAAGQQAWPELPQVLQVPAPPSPSTKQPRPLWQLLPPQQAEPAAPQLLSQVPVPPKRFGLLQPSPVLHVLFAQQTSPEPPQVVQARAPPSIPAGAAQTSEPWHCPAAPAPQHSAPDAPHATQLPFVHCDPEAVQNCAGAPKPPSAPPPQQAWPIPPQGEPADIHELVLDEQVPLTPFAVQASPAPTHILVAGPAASVVMGMQQPPLLQVLAAQQAWPGFPHAAAVLPPVPPTPPVPMLASACPPDPPAIPPAPPAPMLASACPPDPPAIPPAPAPVEPPFAVLPPLPAVPPAMPPLPPDGLLLLLHPAGTIARMPASAPAPINSCQCVARVTAFEVAIPINLAISRAPFFLPLCQLEAQILPLRHEKDEAGDARHLGGRSIQPSAHRGQTEGYLTRDAAP